MRVLLGTSGGARNCFDLEHDIVSEPFQVWDELGLSKALGGDVELVQVPRILLFV